MRQILFARKDLNMSAGKLSAQIAHASIAFLTNAIKCGNKKEQENIVHIDLSLPKEIYEGWILGSFTKTVCEVKNRNQMQKVIALAEENGLKEGTDFFLIKDNCLTELKPEEIDENGIGRTLTCIGFRPLPDEIAHKISKKFQLYK